MDFFGKIEDRSSLPKRVEETEEPTIADIVRAFKKLSAAFDLLESQHEAIYDAIKKRDEKRDDRVLNELKFIIKLLKRREEDTSTGEETEELPKKGRKKI